MNISSPVRYVLDRGLPLTPFAVLQVLESVWSKWISPISNQSHQFPRTSLGGHGVVRREKNSIKMASESSMSGFHVPILTAKTYVAIRVILTERLYSCPGFLHNCFDLHSRARDDILQLAISFVLSILLSRRILCVRHSRDVGDGAIRLSRVVCHSYQSWKLVHDHTHFSPVGEQLNSSLFTKRSTLAFGCL